MTASRTRGFLAFALVCLAPTVGFAAAQDNPLLPGDSSATVFRLYLVGDTGGIDDPDHRVLRLAVRLAGTDEATGLLFLGDNVYPRGLQPPGSPGETRARSRLEAQLQGTRDFPGTVWFVPGNHDWDHSGPDGLASVRRQDAFVDSVLGPRGRFLPDEGLPGPEVIDLDPGPVLVVFDSEWWLREKEKPYGESGRFEIDEEGDLLASIESVLLKEDDRPVVVAAHHPVRSLGSHGGHFPLKTHLFPLTSLDSRAWIPLPVLGSLYPLYVSWFGGRQDLAHWKYASLRTAIERMAQEREDLFVYVSGHEHSLQHFPDGMAHYVVSGSASRPTYVASGRGSAFTSSEPGLMELRFLESGAVDLLAWTITGDGLAGEPAYRSRIRSISVRPAPPPPAPSTTDTADSLHVGAIASSLGAGPIRRFLLGSHHRDAWTMPIAVPVLDVGTKFDGLRPTRRGGGQQTLSIRLENPAGQEYVLRSLTKNSTGSLPSGLRGTVAEDVLFDQVSIIYPFGALLAAALAEPAGVYHSNPELVFVPPDPRLEPWADILAGRIMLLEERPKGDMSDKTGFGGSDQVVSTPRMFREVTGDNDHRVDAEFYARARLFDMLISDWDRHADQWRWATFEPPDERGKIYRPVGRDRDWAFNRMNGLFPSLVRSPFGLDKFQVFGPSYGRLLGLNRSAIDLDRRFASSLQRRDWIRIAGDLATRLDSATVERALDALPGPARIEYGSAFGQALRDRIRRLSDTADRYYALISETVDVVGSNKHERFVVRSPGPGMTEVVVTSTTREGTERHPYYRRVFSSDETREIRLYGLDGIDRYHIEGVGAGTEVFVIGGLGHDELLDASGARRPGTGRAYIYDTKSGMTLAGGPTVVDRRSDDPAVNRYSGGDYPKLATRPLLYLGHNPEDGPFVGGGAVFFDERFRHVPYAASHTFRANTAARTGAFNLRYEGHFVHAFGGFDLWFWADALSPKNVRNYFGLGNETRNTVQNRRYYQARYSRYGLRFALARRIGPRSEVRAGPFLSTTDIGQDGDRFLALPQSGIDPASFSDQWYGGVRIDVEIDFRDRPHFPRQGFSWTGSAAAHRGLTMEASSYSRLESELRVYHTPRLGERITLAFRAGVSHRIGSFPFYAASTLGGQMNLRGWRGTRFAGRTASWQGLEARMRLGHFDSFLVNGAFGVLGFADQGRVWTDGERSDVWHRGYGGGLWIDLVDSVVISSWIGSSTEQTDFTLRGGFFF